MKIVRMKGLCLVVIMLLIATCAAARQHSKDTSTYLPAAGEVAGWSPNGAPENYRGENLFMMINGGADIYHEYGFEQVIGADYVNSGGKAIRLEIYAMENPAAA